MRIVLLIKSLLGLGVLSGGSRRQSPAKPQRIGATCHRKSALAIKEATAARRKAVWVCPWVVVVAGSVTHVAGFVPCSEWCALLFGEPVLPRHVPESAPRPTILARRRACKKVAHGFMFLFFFLWGSPTTAPNRLPFFSYGKLFITFFFEGLGVRRRACGLCILLSFFLFFESPAQRV